MGEMAKYKGEEIKIGTCEEMYYLRADQRHLVEYDFDPGDRFRFPFPDEDELEPGNFGDHDRGVEIPGYTIPEGHIHGKVQFTSRAGYVTSLPCPEQFGQPGMTVDVGGKIEDDEVIVLNSGTEISIEAALGDLQRAAEVLADGEGGDGDGAASDLHHVGELVRLLVEKSSDGLRVGRNGFRGYPVVKQQKVVDGALWTVIACGACGEKWRMPKGQAAEIAEKFLDEAEREEYRHDLGRFGPAHSDTGKRFLLEMAKRIMAGYTKTYDVCDIRSGEVLATVTADSPLAALDAYAVGEGFPPYSDLIVDDPDGGFVYQMPDGTIGAVFTNYEITAKEANPTAVVA